MKPRSLENQRLAPTVATTSRAYSKPSVLKRLKKLVGGGSCQGTINVKSCASCSSLERERRAEALKSVRLLKQSVKYGGPYRDQGDEAESRTIVVPEEDWGKGEEYEEDLIFFEDKADGLGRKEDRAFSSVDEKGMSACPPAPPMTMGPKCSPCLPSDCCSPETGSFVESETSTLTSTSGRPPIRIRNAGSLVEEVDQIKDEESRRLTEIAYLS